MTAVLIVAFPYKTAAFGGGALVHILLEEVAGKGRQGEALVQEGLVDAQAIIKEAAALTLQHNPRRLSEDIQTDAPVMGQRLLCTAVGKEAPAIVTHAFTALQIRVIAAHVHVDTCTWSGIPVDVTVHTGITGLADVGIGRIKHILARGVLQSLNLRIGHEPCHILNTVVGKRVAGRDIDIELLCEVTVTQVESMALLTVQLRITLADIGGVRIIQIRIQRTDSRTIDTHVVPQTQIGHIRQLVADRSGRHYVVEVLCEILAAAHQILHILDGMLVA